MVRFSFAKLLAHNVRQAYNVRMAFQKATKSQSKLRMAIQGPSGGGKTFSALAIATSLGGNVAVIDTENKSASKYAGRFSFDTDSDFDGSFHPDRFIEKLKVAEGGGYDVVVCDSLTHFWNGPGGFLELVDQEAKRMRKPDSFSAWKAVTPVYNRMVQSILGSRCHVIVTMRAKQEYSKTKDEATGKSRVEKLGMAPEMRDNFQYEMDIEGMLDMDHNFIVGKTRCEEIDGRVFAKPGKDLAEILKTWLSDGVTKHQELAARLTAAGVQEPTFIERLTGRLIKNGATKIEEMDEASVALALKNWDHTLKAVTEGAK